MRFDDFGNRSAIRGFTLPYHKILIQVDIDNSKFNMISMAKKFSRPHASQGEMKLSNDVASNLGTLSVRAGEKDYLLQGATQMPVVQSVSFGYPDVDQMQGFGGVLSFTLKDGSAAVRSFLPRLNDAHLAANFGAVETVVPPATTSHVKCTLQERAAMGIPKGLIRYSVGIEDTEDLVADLRQALTAIQ